MWVVGVGYLDGNADPMGRNAKSDILQYGIAGVAEVRTLQTYLIDGDVPRDAIERIGEELLADKVVQFFRFDAFDEGGKHVKSIAPAAGSSGAAKGSAWAVEVFYRPGVMDPVGLSVAKAIEVIGIRGVKSVRTGTTYIIRGKLSEDEVRSVCEKCLANALVQTYRYQRV